jgi:Leucine-rich repeat (LRR) protein
MGDDPMALLGLEGALKHYYYLLLYLGFIFSSLTKLVLRQCSSIAMLPADIGSLSNLHMLGLSECASLTELPANIGALGQLQELDLFQCRSLASLPASLASLQLQQLSLARCGALTHIPNLGDMSKLTSLDITYCNSLVEMPEGLGQLTALKWLKVASCSRLSSWPELDSESDFTGPSKVDDPDYQSHYESQLLTDERRKWPSTPWSKLGLEHLRLVNCPSLTSLPNSLGLAAAVTRLTLHKRRHLRSYRNPSAGCSG